MTEQPELTIKEAAEACGVSPKTIRRRLDAEPSQLPNAYRSDDGNGQWMIPITDLIAAGLQPGKPSPPDADQTEPRRAGTEADELRTKLDAATQAATEAELRATLAERDRDAARAELSRADQTIEAQAQALRMLEAGPQIEPTPEHDEHVSEALPDTLRSAARQGFGRWFGKR